VSRWTVHSLVLGERKSANFSADEEGRAGMQIAAGRKILCRDCLADRDKVSVGWRGARPHKSEHA
jgi:hypothetical protein